MAVCKFCRQEMLTADGCTQQTVTLDSGLTYTRVRAGAEGAIDDRCHDCGAVAGEPHHPKCDMERCPSCEGQLITCGCLTAWLIPD